MYNNHYSFLYVDSRKNAGQSFKIYLSSVLLVKLILNFNTYIANMIIPK